MDRKKILFKNISLSVIYKTIGITLSFIIIPILLDFLDSESYGIWVTIFSVLNMIFFVDFGITNGLKTRLASALSLQNRDLAKKDITNTYIFISCIAFLILLFGYSLINNLDVKAILNSTLSIVDLREVLNITLVLICISFILSIYKPMYYAIQESAKIELALLIYNVGVLVLILISFSYFPKSIKTVAVIYGSMHIIIGLIFSILFFSKNPDLFPSIKYYNLMNMKKLISLSSAFFGIQLCMLVIFTTDNIIISNLIGPTEVTKYDIVRKLFNTMITVLVIAQAPLWAMFTDAYEKNELRWIKQTLNKLNLIFIPILFLIAIFVLSAKFLIRIWIGDDIDIPIGLIVLMGVFVAFRLYGSIYMSFLNGIGAIKAQMFLYMFGAIINIPISVYFVKVMDMGSSGVILGTIISLLLLTVVLPIQSYKILNKDELS